MKRNALVYLVILVVTGLGLLGLLRIGAGLAPLRPAQSIAAHAQALTPVAAPSSVSGFADGLRQRAGEPLSRLFLQLLIIIGASRLAGWAFVRMGQPGVVGEMIAGIFLGPSLFGFVAPAQAANDQRTG